MDIDSLRSFIAFVETGSFTRAAKQTHKTQSAVSMQMKRLEAELGKGLFEKEGRNLILSVQGRRLALYAKPILQLHDQTVAALKSSDVRPRLHLGCPDDYADTILPSIVKLLHLYLPKLELLVTSASSYLIRVMLDCGELDAAIVTRLPDSDEGYLLTTDVGVWIGSEEFELIAQDSLPIILFQKDCKFHLAAIDGLMKLGREYCLMASSSSATAIKGMVKQGIGLGVMAKLSAGSDSLIIESDRLPPLPSVGIALVISSRAHSPFSAELAQQVVKGFAEMKIDG
ncbi:LysR family transcriptional regulator [Shewanella sp. D64]|uniref:LysR family transcriptional regulator n=1 Tax=unclassified Shewanella TaxID=196818 RepID=UPI0022BA515A|nr:MULTISPECIES: LysR family transcriptional regulator [unclassified Shewanella]MEC4727397.1 LysR family transcriptional regulator [Shewanella sp. D64]MEC4739552.1 LysR family transcriptional regulator [Shewanella sp. E94]WBJ96065.1 LysR family transcriptional regulator [Shewanella sp. MTB7]